MNTTGDTNATDRVSELSDGLGPWIAAPLSTHWGAGMMEALVALGKDHTLRLYAEAGALHLVKDALIAAFGSAGRNESDAWAPISTAPDGVMLLFVDMNAAEARHWVFCGWRHNGLRGNLVQMPDNKARTATHWRHLPAAPRRVAWLLEGE